MNVIRGIDRIALVIAIIAILPGFFGGVYLTHEELTRMTIEYKAWKEKEAEREFRSYGFEKEIPIRYEYPPE